LAIVRQLVELHGGTVRVESPGEGQGSTFTVSLPLAEARDATNDLKEASQPVFTLPEFECSSQLTGINVLIVDDEADTRELLQFILEGCGARVRTANSAADALEAVAEEAFDVLISDIGMPEEDGYSLIAKVRALGKERGGKIPAAAGADRLRARGRPHTCASLRFPNSRAEADQPGRVGRHRRQPRGTSTTDYRILTRRHSNTSAFIPNYDDTQAQPNFRTSSQTRRQSQHTRLLPLAHRRKRALLRLTRADARPVRRQRASGAVDDYFG
jgi:hypothetical protein